MMVEQSIEDPNDQFPIGMRVLAVDDDPTCLLLLETLLRRCQYHVTTTNQAITALRMLRENKNKFDLVISDVHMPDMDGFKLLELVGLEMDLPVIMLSANGDTKLVMKGITHGACDYLLKPVRIEELQNIWQHVIRRKKFDPKDKSNSGNHDKTQFGNGEGGLAGMGNVDQSGKLKKRRKYPNEDDDEENDDNGMDIEDPSAQKKPRVVWSVELHRKFVNAVNQLGIDKAVPKRILDLMNVEKLTRENVASHLQKYRLYLKRISSVASLQQHSTFTDSSYMEINSLNQIRNLHTSAGSSSQYHNNGYFRSNPNTGMLDRLNTPYNMGIQTLSSPSGKYRLNNSINYNKHNVNFVGDFSPALRILNDLPDEKMTVPSLSNNPTFSLSNMSFVSSSGQCQETQGGVQFGNHFSQSSVSPGFVNNQAWMTAAQSSRVEANAFLPSSSQMSSSSSSIRCDQQIITDMPLQGWENSVVDVNGGAAQMLGNGSMVFSGNEDFDLIGRSELLDHPENVKDSFGSLEDLARAMTKQEQVKEKLLEGEFGCDSTYAIGTCI